MANIKHTVCTLAVFLSLAFSSHAQVENSFIHTIKEGETVYSISRIYNVTTDDILRLNPDAIGGIRQGDQLRIPQQKRTATNKNRFHTIAAGETLYQLTKKYGVSADDICQANPGLTAQNFKVGMVISIPEKKSAAQSGNATNPTYKPKFKDLHKVERKETIYKIALDYNVTIEDILKLNPEIKAPDYKLKKGEFIRIPYSRDELAKQDKKEKTPTNEELISVKKEKAPQNMVRMGVILPLKSQHSESDKMIEFYRGVLMAVDSMKKNGLSVNVYTFDSGKSAGDIKDVLKNQTLANMDFIIGPLYTGQINPLNEFCKKHGIKLVVPFSSAGEAVYNSPNYFAVTPPKSFQQAEACELALKVFKKQNYIFVDSKESDEDGASFTDALEKLLQQNDINSKTIAIDADEFAWLRVFTRFQTNIIVPNSSSVKLINKLVPILDKFSKEYPEYKVKLLGYPEWQTYTNKHLENFYRFDTYAYSAFYKNPLTKKSKEFNATYQHNFHKPTIPAYPCFGMLGFDLTYYFLKGFSSYGDGITSHLPQIKTSPYQHQFDFERISNWSGFINKEMQFIHYAPSHTIELIRLNP